MTASSGLFSYEAFVHAISGACGSISAMAVTIPLDTVRVRLLLDKPTDKAERENRNSYQLVLKILEEEGILSLYRGAKSTLECVALSNFIYFYTFHGLKKLLQKPQKASTDLIFSCIAGVVNVLLTNPFWVANTRIKLQKGKSKEHSGLLQCLKSIWKTEGISGLWQGTYPSLTLVSNPVIKFTVYELLKRRALQAADKSTDTLSVREAFFLGVLASVCATFATYPIQVVQTKLRHGHAFVDLEKNAGTVQLTLYLLKNFGFTYLYKGLDAKLLQSVISAGFLFLTYEEISALIFAVMRVQKKKIV